MGRDQKRNPVIQFGQNPAEVAVPCVAMHQIGIDVGSVEVDVALKRAENRLQRLGTSEVAGIEIETRDFEPALFEILITEAANIDIDRLCQLAREITDVDARAAINVGRIFVSEEEDLHGMFLLIAHGRWSKHMKCCSGACSQAPN